MATVSFKSVGRLKEVAKQETIKKSVVVPINISTPLKIGDEEILVTNNDLVSAIGDNLTNLIMTNWGERLGLYNFGANLRPLLSEFVSLDSFDSAATLRIKSAVSRWMPFVVLETFMSSASTVENKTSNGTAAIEVTITYSVPSVNIFNMAIVVTLYVM